LLVNRSGEEEQNNVFYLLYLYKST